MDELNQLLAMLGVSSFAEATTAIANMNAQLESAQSALGVKGTAATMSKLVSRSVHLSALEKACGKEGDEAVGVIRAALTSHAEMPKLQSRIAELEKGQQAHALSELFAAADSEKKLTPAIKQSVKQAFDAGEITLKGAETWLANLLPVKALEQRQEAAPSVAQSAAVLTHNNKTFKQMTGPERVALKKADPSLYEAMRKSAA